MRTRSQDDSAREGSPQPVGPTKQVRVTLAPGNEEIELLRAEKPAGPQAHLRPKGQTSGAAEVIVLSRYQIIGALCPPATIRIRDDGYLSKETACIEYRKGAWFHRGAWFITKMPEAKNPIKIDGKEISQARLKHGDTVHLGSRDYVFVPDPPPEVGKGKLVALTVALLLVASLVAILLKGKGPGKTGNDIKAGDEAIRCLEALDLKGALKHINDITRPELREGPKGTYDLTVQALTALSEVSDMDFEGPKGPIEGIANPTIRNKLKALVSNAEQMTGLSNEVVHAAMKCVDDPDSDLRRTSEATVGRFTVCVEKLEGELEKVPTIFTGNCPLRRQISVGKKASGDGTRAIGLVEGLRREESPRQLLSALQSIDRWRRDTARTSKVAIHLAEKADTKVQQGFQGALGTFDFDMAREFLRCAYGHATCRKLNEEFDAEQRLLGIIRARAENWHKPPSVECTRETVFRGLLDLIDSAREHGMQLSTIISVQVKEQLEKDNPDTEGLTGSLDESLRRLADLTRKVRGFPVTIGQPRSLEFLNTFRDPTAEWEAAVTQLRALLGAWAGLLDAIGHWEKSRNSVQAFRQVASAYEGAWQAASLMTDEKVRALHHVAKTKLLERIKLCLRTMWEQQETKGMSGDAAEILRVFVQDFSGQQDSEILGMVERGRVRLRDIERLARDFVIMAHLHSKLGNTEEATKARREAAKIIPPDHPLMQKLKVAGIE